MPLKAFCQRID